MTMPTITVPNKSLNTSCFLTGQMAQSQMVYDVRENWAPGNPVKRLCYWSYFYGSGINSQ